MSAYRKSGYLSSLDGWRAVAVIGVLLTHDLGKFPFDFLDRLNRVGWMGVYVFFAISGVLITWRILEDEKSSGVFDIKGFYIRRLFRIQPAALVYLAVVSVLTLFGVINERWSTLVGALLMVRNFQFHFVNFGAYLSTTWFTGHFWTLSVEEHFYILLSFFFLYVKLRRITVFFAIFCIVVICQHLAFNANFYSRDTSYFQTYWQIQYLLFATLERVS
jgi:peptidoglycan/LPS O-acetylase OafA/YrhL